MGWDVTVDVISQVILAVEHFHFSGILHRDIKAVNILLTPAGQIRIIDFDVSKVSIFYSCKLLLLFCIS
jgi:serine/threonine protein kinase